MTATEREGIRPATRRYRPMEVRRAAARMVIAANTANGEPTDPRIVAIAEGRDPDQPTSERSSEM